MVHITNVMFPHVSNALQKFGARVKGIVPKKPIDNGNNKNKNSSNPNEVEHSDIQPQTPQEKTDGAVKKFNASNEQRIIAATNSFAEIDNDCMLLQEYCAYRNADFKPKEEDGCYLLAEDIAKGIQYILHQREGIDITELTIRPQFNKIQRKKL